MALAAVQGRQCVISAVVAGSSAAAMFPLFITHDEYFVRCGGSGGGYYNVFDLSSYKLLRVATTMAGALPTINNQLKAAAAMAMETTTTTTNKT